MCSRPSSPTPQPRSRPSSSTQAIQTHLPPSPSCTFQTLPPPKAFQASTLHHHHPTRAGTSLMLEERTFKFQGLELPSVIVSAEQERPGRSRWYWWYSRYLRGKDGIRSGKVLLREGAESSGGPMFQTVWYRWEPRGGPFMPPLVILEGPSCRPWSYWRALHAAPGHIGGPFMLPLVILEGSSCCPWSYKDHRMSLRVPIRPSGWTGSLEHLLGAHIDRFSHTLT